MKGGFLEAREGQGPELEGRAKGQGLRPPSNIPHLSRVHTDVGSGLAWACPCLVRCGLGLQGTPVYPHGWGPPWGVSKLGG